MAFFCLPTVRTKGGHPSQKKRKQSEEDSDVEKQEDKENKKSKKNERASEDRTEMELAPRKVVVDDCRENKSRHITTCQTSPLHCDKEEGEQLLTQAKSSQDSATSSSNDQSKGIGQSNPCKEEIEISSDSDDGPLNKETYQNFNKEQENGQEFQIEDVKPESDRTNTGNVESEGEESESEDDDSESEDDDPESDDDSESEDEDPEPDPTTAADLESEDADPEFDRTRTTRDFESEDEEPESDPISTTDDFESATDTSGQPVDLRSPDTTKAPQPTDETQLSRSIKLANCPSKCLKIVALDHKLFLSVADQIYETLSLPEKSFILGQSSSDEEEFDDLQFIDRLFAVIGDDDIFTLTPAKLDSLDDEMMALKEFEL